MTTYPTPHQPHTDGIPDDIMAIAETLCRTLSRTPLKDEAKVIANAILAERNRHTRISA